MFAVYDRVKETTTTSGSGNVTLAGAASSFQSFSNVLSSGDTTFYALVNGVRWETGLGTFDGSTLSRDTVIESSDSGNLIDLDGQSDVFMTYPAQRSVYRNESDQVVVTSSGIKFSDGSIQTIASTGAVSYEWTLADGNGNSESIATGQTITFSGVGGTEVTFDTGSNIISISGTTASGSGTNYTAGTGLTLVGGTEFNIDSTVVQTGDLASYATISYVDSASGALQSQITTLQSSTGNYAQSGDNVSIFTNDAGYLTSHPSISAASSSDNSGRTYIQDILLDSNGHITGIATATETVTDTDTTYSAGDGLDLTSTTFSVDSTVVRSGDSVSLLVLTSGDIPFLHASQISAGTFDDARVAQSNITQHSGAIQITESQIVDLQSYLTSHPSISAASSSDNSGRTYIQDLLLDSNGHVTGIAVATETVTDTDTTYTGDSGIGLVGTTFVTEGDATFASISSVSGGIELPDNEPAITTNKIYNNGGQLYFNGVAISGGGGGGSSTWTVSDGKGNSEVVASGGTVYWSGVGGTDVTYNPATNTIEISGGSGGSSYTAGTGLSLDGTEFNISGVDISLVNGEVPNAKLENSTITITAGTGLSGGGAITLGTSATINIDETVMQSGDNVSFLNNDAGYLTAHPSISAASSSDNSGRTYIQDILLDSNGHVTGITTETESVTDTDTTYTAGTGLSLDGTIFNVSGITESQIVDLGTYSSSGDNISDFVNDSGYLNAESDTLATVTARGSSTSEDITLNGLLTVGTGIQINSSVPASTSNKLYNDGGDLYFNGIQLAAGGGGSYSWTIADESGNSETVASGNTVTFSGVGSILANYDSATNILSISGETYATESYVDSASGNLQSQITSNDSDISGLQTATGVLRTDVDSNDADISTLQSATGILNSNIESNDSDISTLQTATGVLKTDTETNAANITSVSGEMAKSGDNISIFVNDSGYLNAHPTISAASSSDNSGRTYIQDILLDANGHVTGIDTAVETVTDTDTTYTAGTGLSLDGTTFNVSGNYATQSDITSASGSLQSQIDSNDSDISGLQSATGVLRTDVDSNDSDINTLQTATGILRTDIDSNDSDISTLQTATGVLRTDIDSNDSDISALQTATGVLKTDTETNSSNINTVSGLLYTSWTIADENDNSESVTSGSTITFSGVGSTDVTYNTGTNTIEITASGGGSGSPGGSNTQLQYNDSSSFGGTVGLTWDDSSNKLSVSSGILLQSGIPASTENTVYQNSGEVYFDGSQLLRKSSYYEQTYSTGITIDFNNSEVQHITLTGNATLFASNDVAGDRLELHLIQGVGSSTVTWFDGIQWESGSGGGTVPTLSTASGALDMFVFRKISSTGYLGAFIGSWGE